MTPSAKLEAFVMGYEQLRLHAYKPTASDRWTCGYGSTGPDVGPATTWTADYAKTRFEQDMVRFSHGIWLLLHAPTLQQQFDALTSFAYNEGFGALAGSTLLRLHNLGNYPAAATHFAEWNKQRGESGELVVLDGLTKRRAAERAIYESGLYDSSH